MRRCRGVGPRCHPRTPPRCAAPGPGWTNPSPARPPRHRPPTRPPPHPPQRRSRGCQARAGCDDPAGQHHRSGLDDHAHQGRLGAGLQHPVRGDRRSDHPGHPGRYEPDRHRVVSAHVRCHDRCCCRVGAEQEVGTLLLDAGYASNDTFTAPGSQGLDQLIALGKTRSVQAAARVRPASGEPPEGASPRQKMDHRLRTPEGAALYKRRGATVEPGIGNFKKLLPRYSRRGLPAVISETHLAAAVFNLPQGPPRCSCMTRSWWARLPGGPTHDQ